VSEALSNGLRRRRRRRLQVMVELLRNIESRLGSLEASHSRAVSLNLYAAVSLVHGCTLLSYCLYASRCLTHLLILSLHPSLFPPVFPPCFFCPLLSPHPPFPNPPTHPLTHPRTHPTLLPPLLPSFHLCYRTVVANGPLTLPPPRCAEGGAVADKGRPRQAQGVRACSRARACMFVCVCVCASVRVGVFVFVCAHICARVLLWCVRACASACVCTPALALSLPPMEKIR
jgi:hypothetical protein